MNKRQQDNHRKDQNQQIAGRICGKRGRPIGLTGVLVDNFIYIIFRNSRTFTGYEYLSTAENALGRFNPKVPIAIVQFEGMTHGHDVVMMRIEDFERFVEKRVMDILITKQLQASGNVE